MKLRIKGNSIRIRLTRTEVARIASEGYLEEQTSFGTQKLIYALKRVDSGTGLTAAMEGNKITMFIPSSLSNDWPANQVVGFNARMPVGDDETLIERGCTACTQSCQPEFLYQLQLRCLR